MRSFEKDYKYLLQRLIPRHRLTPERRRFVERAVASGQPREMRAASVLALEDLCASRDFERRGSRAAAGRVEVTYARVSGSYQLRLQLPEGEWYRLSGQPAPADAGGVRPPVPPGPAPLAPPVEITIEIVPNIIRWLNIGEERESAFQRLEKIMELLPAWLRFAAGRLILVEERLGGREGKGRNVSTVRQGELLRNPLYERCRRSRQCEILESAAAEALGILEPDTPGTGDPSSRRAAVSPVFSLGELWGMVEFWAAAEQAGPLFKDRVVIATRIIEQTIENAVNLENLTSIDSLTGLFNRGFYDIQGPIEIERATRSGNKLSMLVVDIDDFKSINDAYGHAKGDFAIVSVAELIRKNLRKIDLPFRYGGEEFVILLPGTAQLEAVHTAERLRLVISEFQGFTDEEGRPRGFSVSIGGAMFPDHARTLQELFEMADGALRRVKQTGKNRVEFCQ